MDRRNKLSSRNSKKSKLKRRGHYHTLNSGQIEEGGDELDTVSFEYLPRKEKFDAIEFANEHQAKLQSLQNTKNALIALNILMIIAIGFIAGGTFGWSGYQQHVLTSNSNDINDLEGEVKALETCTGEFCKNPDIFNNITNIIGTVNELVNCTEFLCDHPNIFVNISDNFTSINQDIIVLENCTEFLCDNPDIFTDISNNFTLINNEINQLNGSISTTSNDTQILFNSANIITGNDLLRFDGNGNFLYGEDTSGSGDNSFIAGHGSTSSVDNQIIIGRGDITGGTGGGLLLTACLPGNPKASFTNSETIRFWSRNGGTYDNSFTFDAGPSGSLRSMRIVNHITDLTISYTPANPSDFSGPVSNIAEATDDSASTLTNHVNDFANPHDVTIDQVSPTTTKGDIMVDNGTNVVRFPVGMDGQVLSSNPLTDTGLEWIDQDSNATGPANRVTTFLTSDTFVVPDGIFGITAICQGGGGGGERGGTGVGIGSSGPGSGGPGGGSGFITTSYFNVTPGESLDIIVGAAGTGGTISPSAAATDGGESSVERSGTVLASALGGLAGNPSFATAGAVGGSGMYAGGNGGSGVNYTPITTRSIGAVKDGYPSDSTTQQIGGDGAPGNVAGYDPIQGGTAGTATGSTSGSGGGGGAPIWVPELSELSLSGSGGNGGNGVGIDTVGQAGGDATRLGAGGGGGSGGGEQTGGTPLVGGSGGDGMSGYVVLYY